MTESTISNKSDFQFILKQIEELDHEEFFKQKFPDIFASFTHPSGFGQIPVGLAAYQRLQATARRAIRNSEFKGRIDPERVFHELERVFSKRFLGEKRTVNQSESDKVVSFALRKAAADCIDRFYIFPCHLDHVNHPAGLDIGPVTFRPTSLALDLLNNKLAERKNLGRSRGVLEIDDVIEQFRKFSWTAKVQVKNCDNVISKKVAYRTALAALNCLHVSLGASHTKHFILAGPEFQNKIQSNIIVESAGKLATSGSIGWRSNHFPDDWWEKTKAQSPPNYFDIIGRAITAYRDDFSTPPLATRYIDAVGWYGEAVRDQHLASKIVKLVTSVERITITGNSNNIAKLFATRGAALARMIYDRPYDQLFTELSTAYEVRSDIVHGSRSPEDRIISAKIRGIEHLIASVLQGVVMFYGWKIDRTLSISDIENGYNKLVEWAKQDLPPS